LRLCVLAVGWAMEWEMFRNVMPGRWLWARPIAF
jgi:hypothetical protein